MKHQKHIKGFKSVISEPKAYAFITVAVAWIS